MTSRALVNEQGVFLSYANADRTYAKLIARDLSTRGIDVWYDEWSSRVGRAVDSMLSQAVGSMGWFVVLVSRASLASRWVGHEIDCARRLSRESGKPTILPAAVEDTELPAWVTNTVFADFRADYRDGFERLFERIAELEVRDEYQGFQQLDIDRSRAGLLFRQGRYEEARKLYEDCLRRFEIARAYIQLNLGAVAFNQNRFDESLALTREAHDAFVGKGDLRAETRALQYLAHHHGLLGDHDKAEQMLKQLLVRTQGRTLYWWNVMRLGMLQIERRTHEEAWRTLEGALEAFRKKNERFGMSAVKYYMARIRIAERKTDEALRLLDEAMPYSRETEDPKGVTTTLVRYAECALLEGDFAAASRRLREMREWLERVPDGNVVLEAQRIAETADDRLCPEESLAEWRGAKEWLAAVASKHVDLRRRREALKIGDCSTFIEGV
ncbi:MAG: toll/interleukin-1 receptor domain-containing protein [Candidatus Eisenbacteria bacterium]